MYSIMRTEKHKMGGGLKSALQHLYRERDTPNADPDIKNYYWGKADGEQTSKNSMQKLHSKIEEVVNSTGRKLRKDAVVAVEYVMTASPEFFTQFSDEKKRNEVVYDFANKAREWISEQYPHGKIIAAQVHLDETTPHVSIFVTPCFRNKKGEITFSAKSKLGGRQLLSEHQDSFSKKMQVFGLKRGIKNSKATHEKVSRFYAKVEKSAADFDNISSKEAEKIQKLSGVFGSKTELAELASELSHDNAVLRQAIIENDEQRRVERLTDAHKTELDALENAHVKRIKQLTDAHKTELKNTNGDYMQKMQTLQGRNNELSRALAALDKKIMKHDETNEKRLVQIAELERKALLSDHYQRALNSTVNALEHSERPQISKFMSDVRRAYYETAIAENVISFDDLSEHEQNILNNIKQTSTYKPRM